MSFLNRLFNHQFETIGAAKVPRGVGDRYYAQDLACDMRYMQGLAGRLFLQSLGVSSALVSGGIVTEGSSKTEVNISAAVGMADFDVDVIKDSDGWAVPAPTETAQIPMRIEVPAQTDFDISGATLDGSTVNYLKARYAEANVQTRVKQFAAGSYNYAVRGSFVLAADASAPTDKDVVLCSFIGNGTSTLAITQRYPVGPAGQQMAECAELGVSYDGSDAFLGEKLKIAYSNRIGNFITPEIFFDPVTWANAKSTSNPSGSEYAPYIPRHDGNHDVASSQAPLIIDPLRAQKLSVSGYDSFACTVAASTITVSGPSTTVRDALLGGLIAAGLVNQWHVTEAATFAGSGALYTGARQYCANINGVDYPITGVNAGTFQITVTGTPASGAQTLIIYPFRIAGEEAKVRLRKRTGFVPVVANDATSKVLIGLDVMDEGQGHWHELSVGGTGNALANFSRRIANQTSGSQFMYSDAAESITSGNTVTDMLTDGPNGTPRIGKNTSPRSFGVGMYTFARTLLATDWTTAA